MKAMKVIRIVTIIMSIIAAFMASCWALDAVYEWRDIDIAAHAVVRAFVWLLVATPFVVAAEGLALAIRSIEDRQLGLQMKSWQQKQEDERISQYW